MSQANRLKEFECIELESGLHIKLACCRQVAVSIAKCLGQSEEHLTTDDVNWPYALDCSGNELERVRELLGLYEEILTISRSTPLEDAFALDFHTVPPDNGGEWRKSGTGDLVHKGKNKKFTSSGRELANRIHDVVLRHPLMNQTTRVAIVPGTRSRFGERLAAGVAKRLDVDVVKVSRKSEIESPAKDGWGDREPPECVVEEGLNGERLLIVDDVWRSGKSMKSVERALSNAGARSSYGIVCTRTMRN